MTSLRFVAVLSFAAGLACGGLPGSVDGAPPTTNVDAPEPPPVELPTPLPDAQPASDPYAQFAPLDAGEPPPKGSDPTCPPETSVIRYPRGPALEVYCATTQGMKQGPWHRVQGGVVTEVRDYDQGQQVGRTVRWEKNSKVAEQNWVAGQQEGDLAEWNDVGILMLRGTMQAGKRHGKFLLRAPAHPEAFDGRCYQTGEEAWATTDPAEFVAKTCP